jgi:hypothetical protein
MTVRGSLYVSRKLLNTGSQWEFGNAVIGARQRVTPPTGPVGRRAADFRTDGRRDSARVAVHCWTGANGKDVNNNLLWA